MVCPLAPGSDEELPKELDLDTEEAWQLLRNALTPSTATIGEPYYRQVHPNNFQDGRAISPAFVLQDTGCHFTLSLNDGRRTTAERCYRDYAQHDDRLSAAALEVTAGELAASSTDRVVDSPNEQTHAHMDAMYEKPITRRQQRNAAQAQGSAANRRGPAYVPGSG